MQIRVEVWIGKNESKFIGLPQEATVSTLCDKLLKKGIIRFPISSWVFRIKSQSGNYRPAEKDIPLMNGDAITVTQITN